MDKGATFPKLGPEAIEVCGSLAGAVVISFIYGVLAYLSLELTLGSNSVAAFWMGNAVVVGMLLGRGMRCRVAAVSLCFLANIAAYLAVGISTALAVILSGSNMLEILLALFALDRLVIRSRTFDNLSQFVKLAVVGALVPFVSGAVSASAVAMLGGGDWLTTYGLWVAAHSLQIPIFASVLLILRNSLEDRSSYETVPARNWAALIAATLATAALIFGQTTFPFLFLAMPLVIFAAFTTGRLGTAVVVAILSLVASLATLNGMGPIALVKGGAREEVIALEAFLLSCLAIGLPVAVALANKASIRDDLQESRDLVESILAGVGDLVFRVDANWRFTYANPRWKKVTGFAPEDLIGTNPFQNLIDRNSVDLRAEKHAIEKGRKIAERIIVQTTTAEGRTLQFAVGMNPQFDRLGNFVGGIGTATDVTEKLAREHALTESEKRFRRLAETAPVGIFQANAKGEITYAASQWVERFGLKAEDLIGHRWKDALATGEELENDPAFAGFDQTNPIRHRVLNFRNRQGEEFWWETINSAEFDESGNVSGFVGVAHDITEQRLADERLRESERRFQALANMAPAGIFRTDATGSCTYVNAAWKSLSGLEDGQWEGDGWSSAVHPEDLDRVVAIWVEAVRTQTTGEEEFRWLRPDGSIVWTHVTFGPEFGENGAVTGYIGVVSNITEEVEARLRLAEREQQLALLADNATDAVLRLDLDGVCKYASPSARQVFGLDPALFVGNQFITGFHEDDADEVVSQFRALASGELDNVRITFRSKSLILPDEYAWLEANCGLVREGESGEPLEIIASLRNVDQTKQLESDLLEAKERAESAAAAKSDFLANMSHEIRTPMNGVIGFTEVALAGELDEELRSNLEMLADSGKAMLALLNDLLDSAKIDAGRMLIEPQPVNVRHKLRGAITMMTPAAARKDVEIVLEADDDVPEWLESDPTRLRQIALNLIGNAVKFTESGRITVSLRTAEGGERFEIAVSDTGIGIPQDKLEQIFEKFTQADSSIDRRFGGTGLGLPICAQLADLLGGSIAVESKVGKGSTFTLTLPLVTVDAPGKTTKEVKERRQLSESTLNARILVAEDNLINQQVTLAMLERIGLSATIATDGQDAVDRVLAANVSDEPFDLVLMDVQMPVLDGLAATRAIRAAGVDAKRLPIIAVTANAFAENTEECLAAGMQGHLPKPLSLDDLAEVLEQWLGVPPGLELPQPPRQPSEKLRKSFSKRKAKALEAIDAAIRKGELESCSLGEVATQLHQIAGVAAFFGETDLGAECSQLDQRLRKCPDSVKAHDFTVVRSLLQA
ncbi:PAS domain S-box protein [Qipengyuania polymorpha]|nr:PAS domain S-box protein [Qipengyuania polymorpha]